MDPMQNQNQPMGTPNMAQQSAPKKSYGPLIGIIVIVILLIVGAFYVWGGKLSGEPSPEAAASLSTTPEQDAAAIQSDIESIDTDVDLSGIDNI